MSTLDLKTLNKLDEDDQEKIAYFLNLLMSKAKYRKLKEELSNRRDEISRGEVLSHKDVWNELNV